MQVEWWFWESLQLDTGTGKTTLLAKIFEGWLTTVGSWFIGISRQQIPVPIFILVDFADNNKWVLNSETTKLVTLVVLKIKKDLDHSKSLISLALLAPRPGLEPGTYGLTVRRSTDWAIEECIRLFLEKNCLESQLKHVDEQAFASQTL